MQDSNRENKKDAILRAAEEEFMQKGFDGARMMEIAKKAGVGHPLLHYHFSNKKKLFQNVISGKFNILAQSVLFSLDETDKDIEERIGMIVSRHFDFVQQHADYLRFIINELEVHPELLEEVKPFLAQQFENASNKLQLLLDAAAEDGKIQYMNASTLVLDIISLNAFCIWSRPLMNTRTKDGLDHVFLAMRKTEIVKMILGRLRIE